MGYRGKSIAIAANRGGYYNSPNLDLVAQEMMVGSTKNINLHEDAREKRGGTSQIESGYGGSQIMGGFDFTMNDGTQFNMVGTTDGKIWKDSSTSLHTFATTGQYVSFEVMNNVLYICNGANIPQVWDGSAGTTSDITLTPTDWTGSNFPSHMVIHGKGESERLWAIGAKPNIIYASELNDGTSEADFSDANVTTIQIETSDGFGIVAGIEFGDKLICFSKRRAYIVDDTNTDDTKWGYQSAQWNGGVGHHRLLVRTPNDLFAMMEDGEVYSVTTAEQFGDYKEASISRPAFMDKWLRENARFTDIEKFHATYDPELRLIKWFIVRAGQTQVDTALVFYLDRAVRYSPTEAWMIHDNQSNASGYSASASWNYRLDPPEDHRDYIYTGGYDGVVWDLEEVNRNDNNTAYTGAIKTPHMPFGDARLTKKFRRGWISTTAQGSYNLTVNKWVDGVQLTSSTISLAGVGAILDSFILDTDVLGGGELLSKDFDIGAVGKRLQLEFTNSGTDENFLISQIMVDVKPLGNRPQ